MTELMLLKLMLNRQAYLQNMEHVDLQHVKETTPELYYVFNTLISLHEQLEQDFTLDELQAAFFVKYPDAGKGVYAGLFSSLAELSISDSVATTLVNQLKRNKALLKLSEKAYAASQGRETDQSLLNAFESVMGIKEEAVSDETPFVTKSLKELVNGVVATPGIRWPLNCLNRSLGSLRKGDFGFLFARPETGKTTFLAHVVGHALDQVSSPIVWFNNEEVDDKVILRVYQSYFNVTLQHLMQHLDEYEEKFPRDKFLMVDSSKIEIAKSSVETILRNYSPSLIIYDQIDKIKGFKADRDDLVYGEIYQWARELAKNYAPSIGVCQASGAAEGQRWLNMDHVANAKTSKQAEADWILGIGCVHEEAIKFVRFLNISKNKLVGDSDSIPALRHGHFEVSIDPERARYNDIREYA